VTKPIRTHQEAEAEIRAAVSWYETQRPGLGRELWDQVHHSLRLISEHPAIGSIVHRVNVRGTARRVPLRRFPYFVVYREAADYVEIIALAHTSRLPGYWRIRG
jgi:toxin ParE1/3/4